MVLTCGFDRAGRCALRVGLGGFAAALAVADSGVCCWLAAGQRTIDTLTDVAPPGAAAKVTAIAERIPGVVRVEQVRARAVGQQTFIDLQLAVSRILPLDRVSALKDQERGSVAATNSGRRTGGYDRTSSAEQRDDLDRVMVIARNRALAVHHVTVHELRDKLAVSLDLEVDGRLSLGAAHEMADGLEGAIAAELAQALSRDTH